MRRMARIPDDTPVLDFLINATIYGLPLIFCVVVFLAALRILGWM